MRLARKIWWVVRAFGELAFYDIVSGVWGFRGVEWLVRKPRSERVRAEYEAEVCDAVLWATIFYCRQVQCLQRSVVMGRLLRGCCGANAEVVIGYRAVPFVSHAWLEIHGRVVGDSSAYPAKMHVLARI